MGLREILVTLLDLSTCTYLRILDPIVVSVLWAWCVLTNILRLRQGTVELFVPVPSIGLREAILSLGLFDRQRQLAKGGVRLLRVERLGQGRQVFTTTHDDASKS